MGAPYEDSTLSKEQSRMKREKHICRLQEHSSSSAENRQIKKKISLKKDISVFLHAIEP